MRLGTAVAALVGGGLRQKAQREFCNGLGILRVSASEDSWMVQHCREPKSPGPRRTPLDLQRQCCVCLEEGTPGPRLSSGAVLGLPPPQKDRRPQLLPALGVSLCARMSAKMLLIKGISRALLLGPGCSHLP